MIKTLEPLLQQSLNHGLSPKSVEIAQTLLAWLETRLQPKGLDWVEAVVSSLLQSGSDRVLFARFSEVSRRVGKDDLALTPAELEQATQIIPGWNPAEWSVDQATRSLLMVCFVAPDAEHYKSALTKVLTAADIYEQVAWYQSLPLLPYSEAFEYNAVDGLRTNINAVFNAIALRNPYPSQHFDELAWNQMVLKSLFIESPLSQIQGLDQRANPTLAKMLRDYAHERWAAGREVNLQLWRLVGPFADDELISDLDRALSHPSPIAQQAAALACASAPGPEVKNLLKKVPAIQEQIESQALNWEILSPTAP